MILKKFLACGLLAATVFGFSNIVNAGVMEDINAANPKITITAKKTLDIVGNETVDKEMDIYRNKKCPIKFKIKLLESSGMKAVLFSFIYIGKQWIFMDYVHVGDGQELLKLMPGMPPRRSPGSYVSEILMVAPTIEELEFMKNAKVIRAVSDTRGSQLVEFKLNPKDSLEYYQAIDYALRFLKEK